MKTFAVDFETFYSKDYSVVDMGVTAYVNDPRFDAYMVSIVGDDGFEWVGHPKDAPWERIDGCVWVSHNAAFDEQVFDRIQLDGVVPPHIAPSDWWCTASMAVYLQAPRSLAGACKQLLGEFVDKSVRAQQLGRVASADELNADPALREYALQDSRRCLRLWAGFSDKWPQKERRLARLTYQWGVDGIHVDVSGASEDLTSLLKQREEALAQIPWATTAAPLSVIALRKHCAALGVWTPDSFDQKNADAIRWEDELSEKYPFVKAVRTYRRTNVLGQKYQTLLARTRDGVFPYAMKYCGAAPTFRWSGDSGLNVQNLPRGELFGCDFRRRLVARPGHTFVICDLGQIEVRVLAYLAGNHAYLDKMRQGLNPYEAAAEQMYSPELLGGSGKGLKKRNPALYATTKAIVLGCGYSMGSRKFAETAPALTGGEYAPSLKDAEKAVELYRASNQPVVQLWDALHNGMRKSLGETYEVELPSGRTLRYFGVRRIGDKYTATKEMGGTADYFYGGKLCIAEDTPVLTYRGWVAIQSVQPDDLVWDGCDWVKQDGPVFNGNAPVIEAHGAHMTPDHKVLTTEGWKDASSCEKYQRADCRIPEGYETDWERLRSDMGGGLRMREDRADEDEGIYQHEKTRDRSVLRMSTPRYHSASAVPPRYDASPSTRSVAVNDSTLHFAVTQGMEKLRRSWDNGVRSLARMFREFLGRHGRFIHQRAELGQGGQQLGVFQRELRLENKNPTGKQQTGLFHHPNPTREYVGRTGSGYIRGEPEHGVLSASPRVESVSDVEHTPSRTSPVYDLTNCGPRNRFTIATPTGPLIVHNCENATQAMARDVFADALLRIHDSGIGRIVWHVHDEVIVEVPIDRAQAASEEVRRLMCIPPDWCPTIPLDAEFAISSHYCK